MCLAATALYLLHLPLCLQFYTAYRVVKRENDAMLMAMGEGKYSRLSYSAVKPTEI